MIYFTLPNFFEHLNLNNFFIKLQREHNDFFKEKIIFHSVQGQFPYCYWAGNANHNHGDGAFLNNFKSYYEKSFAPIRFDCSNFLLNEYDYKNRMINLILKENENGSNIIQLHDLDILDYLLINYNNYKFIYSNNNILKENYNVEYINNLEELDTFYLIQLPKDKIFDFDFINQIKNKNKLDITIDYYCALDCKNYNFCQDKECQYIYNYSNKSVFSSCKKEKNKSIIDLKYIKENYIPLGINHFTISPILFANCNQDQIFNFYVNYFIKKEYIPLVYSMMYGEYKYE